MLILYTTVSCSTAGEVISTALYCKHWSYSRASEASYQAGVHPYFCQAITKGRNFWIHCPHIHAQVTCILLDFLSLETVGLLFLVMKFHCEVKEHLCVKSCKNINMYNYINMYIRLCIISDQQLRGYCNCCEAQTKDDKL